MMNKMTAMLMISKEVVVVMTMADGDENDDETTLQMTTTIGWKSYITSSIKANDWISAYTRFE